MLSPPPPGDEANAAGVSPPPMTLEEVAPQYVNATLAVDPALAADFPELVSNLSTGATVVSLGGLSVDAWSALHANASALAANVTEALRDIPVVTLAPAFAPLAAAAPTLGQAPGQDTALPVLAAAAPGAGTGLGAWPAGSPQASVASFAPPTEAGGASLVDVPPSSIVASVASSTSTVARGGIYCDLLNPYPVPPGSEYRPLPPGWSVFGTGPSYLDVARGSASHGFFEASLIATLRTYGGVPLVPADNLGNYQARFYTIYQPPRRPARGGGTEAQLSYMTQEFLRINTEMPQDIRTGTWIVDNADITRGSGRNTARPAMMAKAYALHADLNPAGYLKDGTWYRTSAPGWLGLARDTDPGAALFALTGYQPQSVFSDQVPAADLFNIANGPDVAAVTKMLYPLTIASHPAFNQATQRLDQDGISVWLNSPVGLPNRATVWGEGFGAGAVSLELSQTYVVTGQDSNGLITLLNPAGQNIVWDDGSVGWYLRPTPEITLPLAALRLTTRTVDYVSARGMLPPVPNSGNPNQPGVDPLGGSDSRDVCGVLTGANKCLIPDLANLSWDGDVPLRGGPEAPELGLGTADFSLVDALGPMDSLPRVTTGTAYYDMPSGWKLLGSGDTMLTQHIVQGSHKNCWMLAAMMATMDAGQKPALRVTPTSSPKVLEADFYFNKKKTTLRMPAQTLLREDDFGWYIDGTNNALLTDAHHIAWPAFWVTAAVRASNGEYDPHRDAWGQLDVRAATPTRMLELLTGRTAKLALMDPQQAGQSLINFRTVALMDKAAKTICTTPDGVAAGRQSLSVIPHTSYIIATAKNDLLGGYVSAMYGSTRPSGVVLVHGHCYALKGLAAGGSQVVLQNPYGRNYHFDNLFERNKGVYKVGQELQVPIEAMPYLVQGIWYA